MCGIFKKLVLNFWTLVHLPRGVGLLAVSVLFWAQPPLLSPHPCQASNPPASVTSEPVLMAPGAATSFTVSSYAGDSSEPSDGPLAPSPARPSTGSASSLQALLYVHDT